MDGIVTTDWLAQHLADEGLRLLDTRSSFAVYEEQHLPDAQFLHIETLRMCDHGIPCKMHDVPVMAALFGRLGIGVETPVITYATRPVDHVSASLTAWSLAVTGNHSARILDGGYDKWAAENRETTRLYPPIADVPYAAQFDDSIFADWVYVRDHLGDPNVVLVDSRTRALYEGRVGPTIRLGHIPGAVLHNYIWDFTHDGTYLPEAQLRAHYEQAGITPDKEIISYCITGREGSAVWFMLKKLLKYPRVRLYQASITEWAAIPEVPMVTGPSPAGTGEAGEGPMKQAA